MKKYLVLETTKMSVHKLVLVRLVQYTATYGNIVSLIIVIK